MVQDTYTLSRGDGNLLQEDTYPPSRADSDLLQEDRVTTISSNREQVDIASDAVPRDTGVMALTTNDNYPPADGGPDAIRYLFASFVIECIVWAIPSSYGIFLNYYLTSTPLGKSPNASLMLTLVGTCQSGIIYFASPLVFGMLARYPRLFRPVVWIGLFTLSLSLILASFATQVVRPFFHTNARHSLRKGIHP